MQVKVLSDSHPENHQAYLQPTVLLLLDDNADIQSIQFDLDLFSRHDDVFSDDFLTHTVVVQGKRKGGRPIDASQIQWASLQRDTVHGPWKPSRIITIEFEEALEPGPYFLTLDNTLDITLSQAWRMYPDTQEAFATTFVPSLEDPMQ